MLKGCDLVRYVGHNENCRSSECDGIDSQALLGKILPVIETVGTEVPAVVVDFEGTPYTLLATHVEIVQEKDLYAAGVLEGLRQAAVIAESEPCACKAEDVHDGCCASCGKRIARMIREHRFPS